MHKSSQVHNSAVANIYLHAASALFLISSKLHVPESEFEIFDSSKWEFLLIAGLQLT